MLNPFFVNRLSLNIRGVFAVASTGALSAQVPNVIASDARNPQSPRSPRAVLQPCSLSIYRKRSENIQAPRMSHFSDARCRLRAGSSSPNETSSRCRSPQVILPARFVRRMYNQWLWACLLKKKLPEAKPITMGMSNNFWRGRRTCQLRALLRCWFHRAGAGMSPDLPDTRRCCWRRQNKTFSLSLSAQWPHSQLLNTIYSSLFSCLCLRTKQITSYWITNVFEFHLNLRQQPFQTALLVLEIPFRKK